MDDHKVESQISSLWREGKWEDIINFGKSWNYEAWRILWVWPSMNDLDWIKEIILEHQVQGIISVGCGTGLLEWIIQQCTKCEVIGVEADKCWWQSKYSPTMYLNKIMFVTEANSTVDIPSNYAMLFCYFNDGDAFYDYMKNYSGRVIFIIGPDKNQNRCTDPLPFDGKLNELGWRLSRARKLDNEKDFFTVYVRLKSVDNNK
ncbi:uncharacterized protein LOC135167676 [Diachasmimorpha longicaudata]|uniref:uncharacterized protein LOC135167676 n=1 Tax=Diachasmimorpha longicaudata TaxID=58733 RepID=UPI0030B8DFE0